MVTSLAASTVWIGLLLYPVASFSGVFNPKSDTSIPTQEPMGTTLINNEATSAVSGLPRQINIPSLNLTLDVRDGTFDPKSEEWTLSDDAVHYATSTVPLNSEQGSTFIYGHNSNQVFGSLKNIKPGDEVTVTSDNGYVFTYKYKDSQTVKPTDTSVLDYEGSPRLMLQTCTGLWNENRQMFYFYLTDYRKL